MDVSHSQIAVFDGGLENPFNDWPVQHVRQGFSWRPGSVSFKTLIESGPIRVEVLRPQRAVLTNDCVRAVSVPFTCQEGASIEVATISESRQIDLEPGEYQLVFETGGSDADSWCRFLFVRDGTLEPEILVKDAELHPTEPLLMDAEPA